MGRFAVTLTWEVTCISYLCSSQHFICVMIGSCRQVDAVKSPVKSPFELDKHSTQCGNQAEAAKILAG